MINYYNFKPIFTHEQLVASIRATILVFSLSYIATIVDLDILHYNIYTTLSNDFSTAKYNSTVEGHYSTDFFLTADIIT